VSLTVTRNVHVPVRFPASVTVQVTVVGPFGNALPEAGTQTTGLAGNLQLSFPWGVGYVTKVVQTFASVLVVMLKGHLTLGASLSTTVTVKVQLPVRVAASVTVHVTVVVPFVNAVPDAGLHITASAGRVQLSLLVGVV